MAERSEYAEYLVPISMLEPKPETQGFHKAELQEFCTQTQSFQNWLVQNKFEINKSVNKRLKTVLFWILQGDNVVNAIAHSKDVPKESVWLWMHGEMLSAVEQYKFIQEAAD